MRATVGRGVCATTTEGTGVAGLSVMTGPGVGGPGGRLGEIPMSVAAAMRDVFAGAGGGGVGAGRGASDWGMPSETVAFGALAGAGAGGAGVAARGGSGGKL